MQQQDNHEYPFLYQRQTCHQVQPNQATYNKRQKSPPATSDALSSGNETERYKRVSFPLSAAALPQSTTKSRNLSETAEVPACTVPSRSPLPALAIAPETKLGTASSGLGTLEP